MRIEKMITFPTDVKPITCPRCGSVRLSFVSEHHKEFGFKIVALLFITIATCCLMFQLLPDLLAKVISAEKTLTAGTFAPTVVFAVAALVCQIIVIIRESSTHVQGICRDCGCIWLLN